MQDRYRYIPDRILQSIAHSLNLHLAEVEAVASFYSFFETREKLGKYDTELKFKSCQLSFSTFVSARFIGIFQQLYYHILKVNQIRCLPHAEPFHYSVCRLYSWHLQLL